MAEVRRPHLAALAERRGILPAYVDLGGVERRASDATREELLAALGIDASTEAACGAGLLALEREETARPLAPARVEREGRAGARRVRVRLPAGLRARGSWSVELAAEGGGRTSAEGRLGGGPPGEARLALPETPARGYHRLRVMLDLAGRALEAEQDLIVVPDTCCAPAELTGGRRAYGLTANLYTVRSARNWGAGDLTDLRRLVRWSGAAGADFVGVNPLHALRNRGWDVSPYGPVSRLYRNPLYLDVEAVPEAAGSPAVVRRLASPGLRSELERLRSGARVDHADVIALQRSVLEELHRAFAARHRGRRTSRGRAYAGYLEREGPELLDFATFLALEEDPAASGVEGGWRRWPAGYRDPRSREIAEFRARRAEAVDLHRWIQFELDRQLAGVAREARDSGLALGVYQDLAIGTQAGGSDPWAFPGLFVEGASVGAPPDDFSVEGQDWGLPPIDPARLAAGGYRYWIRLLRSAFAHAGALRIDHVMGLFRLFWIPAGRSGKDGAYVRYPAEELVGILALESRRHGAAVVGEDLGTVPPEVRPALARRGVLSSRVLTFERDAAGAFLPARRYPRRALVTANTHDLPPLAGFWLGRDLRLRREAGHIRTPEELRAARRARAKDRRALLRLLRREGRFREAGIPPPPAPGRVGHPELCAAVTAFLCGTPAALAGVALDDLARETDPVNLPGVPLDRYPSWSRKMRLSLEELERDPGVALALRVARGARGGERPGASA